MPVGADHVCRPRGTNDRLQIVGADVIPRTELPGANRGALWIAGPLVCPVLVQMPIANAAADQNKRNLESFINFLCPLNIITCALLQALSETFRQTRDEFYSIPRSVRCLRFAICDVKLTI